jgi:putative aldouronate transport system substrate-binding protein
MKKIRWITCLVVLVTFSMVISGCSIFGGDSGSSEEDVVTYSMGSASTKLTWDTPIQAKMTEETGVKLQYDEIVGDLFQRWDIWLASGDYPNILRLDKLHLQKYIDADAVIPLQDLIDEHGPNIKEKFGDRYDMLKDDNGDIHSLVSVNLAEEAPADSKGTFIVQYAVLEDAGFPEIKTLDQLHKLIKDYKAKYPQIDGRDTIGFSSAMESFMINITFNNPVTSASGLPDHGNFYLEDDNDVIWNPISDNSKKYYKFLNTLIQEDLYDIEAFSMDLEAFQTKLSQGRVLAAYAPHWVVNAPNSALRADGNEDRMYAHLPLLFDESIENRSVSIRPLNAGTHHWAITNKTKNPERIIQFIDFLFSDEGQILSQWGIEGEHYEVVDGERVVKDEWLETKAADEDAEYKAGFMSEGTADTEWFGIGNGARLEDGSLATPLTNDLVKREYSDKTKEVLAAYNIETWADLLPSANVVPGYVWQIEPPENTLEIGQRLEETWRRSVPRILLSENNSQFESEWKTFVAEAKEAGVEQYNESFTKKWKEFLGN